MDLGKNVPGLCSEMCPASSHEGNGDIRIKTEAVSDVEEEEDSVSTSFLGIKAQREVSCTSVCPLLGTLHTGPLLAIVFLISSCLCARNNSTLVNGF
jgi:hypothetical protein